MGIFSKRAEPIEKEENVTDKVEEDALLSAILSDDAITFEDAMKIPAFSSCINLIANTISMIPIKLYKVDGDAVEEIKDDERVKLLNKDTKDTLDAVQFKRAIVRDYYRKGGYAYINKIGNKVQSLNYVDNKEISFQYATDPIYKAYKIMIRGVGYEPYAFLKILRNTKTGRDGESIIEESKDLLSVAYNSLKYEKNLVKSGGNKKGFVKSPKKLGDPAMKALKEAWRKLYQNNSENVVILNEGLDFQESSNTSVEMQMNENKKTNSDEICKIFNMPPEMLRGNAKDLDKINFIQYCINPILTALECTLNRDLLLEKEKDSYFFAADTEELTKGDLKNRYDAWAIACKNGFMQIDEVRRKENMPELGLEFIKFGLQDVMYDPNTKKFYVPNMNSIGTIGEGGDKGDANSNQE